MEKKIESYSLVFSEYFDTQLQEIYLYIAEIEYRPLVANNVIKAILDLNYEEIKFRPYAFPKSTGFQKIKINFRQAIYKSWVITFKVENNNIEILTIVHGSRHPKRRIK